MTLPAGLSAHSTRLDDNPHARGALTLCRALADRREAQARAAAIPDRVIADHAALVVGEACTSPERQDRYGAFSCSG